MMERDGESMRVGPEDGERLWQSERDDDGDCENECWKKTTRETGRVRVRERRWGR